MRFPTISWLVTVIVMTALPLLSQDVQSITIRSSWRGLGTPANSSLKITKVGSGWRGGGRGILQSDIDSFITAAESDTARNFSWDSLGVTPAWLADNMPSAVRNYTVDRAFLPEQVSYLSQKCTDATALPAVYSRLFAFHTDDFPSIEVSVTFQGGRVLSVSSRAQGPLMVPWDIKDGSRAGSSYNGEISRTILTLLPKQFTKRGRLSDENLANAIVQASADAFESDLQRVRDESLRSQQLAALAPRFQIVERQGDCLESVDTENCGWNAKLKGGHLPANLRIGLHLRTDAYDRLLGIGEFLSAVDKYVVAVETPAWFQPYLTRAEDVEIELRYVDDRSLSSMALKSVVEDLTKHGRSKEAERISEQSQQVAFIEVHADGGWSRWVALPGGEMVLWHFQGPRVLKWKATDFKSWDYYGWKSVGAVISTDGEVEH